MDVDYSTDCRRVGTIFEELLSLVQSVTEQGTLVTCPRRPCLIPELVKNFFFTMDTVPGV